MHAY
jgi:hypothetical protein